MEIRVNYFPLEGKQRSDFFECFLKYTQEEVLNIIKLELLLVLFTVEYLGNILIPEKKKGSKLSLRPW